MGNMEVIKIEITGSLRRFILLMRRQEIKVYELVMNKDNFSLHLQRVQAPLDRLVVESVYRR